MKRDLEKRDFERLTRDYRWMRIDHFRMSKENSSLRAAVIQMTKEIEDLKARLESVKKRKKP